MRVTISTLAGLLVGLMLAPQALAGGDGPEISRSRGKKGGAVVLYPRLVPETVDPAMQALAGQVQQRLAASAARVVGDRLVDVRPDPERVCPQDGCKGASLGVMIGHAQGGCAIVAQVGSPGAANRQLFPLAGTVHLASATATFRQPPERLVTVTEFVPCDQVIGGLDLAAVESALGAAAAE